MQLLWIALGFALTSAFIAVAVLTIGLWCRLTIRDWRSSRSTIDQSCPMCPPERGSAQSDPIAVTAGPGAEAGRPAGGGRPAAPAGRAALTPSRRRSPRAPTGVA